MRLGAAQAGEREAVADLDALHGLDPHHGRGEARVEAVLLAGVRAEPRRDAGRAHLDAAAERVLVLARRVDRGGIGACLGQRLAAHVDADLAEQRLRDGAGRDVHRGVPRRGALERVAHVVEAELLDAGEIGVPRPRQRDRLRPLPLRLAVRRPRAHPPRPVLVVAVADDERERRAERAAVAEAGEHLDLVRLDLLARRAAVALLPPPQVGVDRVLVERQPGGQAGDDRDERRPVRLAGGCELEVHAERLETREPRAMRPRSAGAGAGSGRAASPPDRAISRLGLVTVPDAEARCCAHRGRATRGATITDIGMAAEVLDDLRPLHLPQCGQKRNSSCTSPYMRRTCA